MGLLKIFAEYGIDYSFLIDSKEIHEAIESIESASARICTRVKPDKMLKDGYQKMIKEEK